MVVIDKANLGTHSFSAATRDLALYLGIGRSGLNNVRATSTKKGSTREGGRARIAQLKCASTVDKKKI